LNKRKTVVGKKAAESKREMYYLKDRDINECDCEQLRSDFFELRAEYQHEHGRERGVE
jgi:hypothetical protein